MLEIEQLQAVQIDDPGSHSFDLEFGTDDTRSRLPLGVSKSLLQSLGASAQLRYRIDGRSGTLILDRKSVV